MNIAVQVEMHDNQDKPSGSGLIPRHTVAAIVALRDAALAKFDEAYSALSIASEAQKAATSAWSRACSATGDRYTHSSRNEKHKFINSIEMIDRKDYLATARRLVDVDVWAHVIKLTDLERLMDKTAKDQFHRELQDDPPEATVDNICATLERFALDAGDIFKRGIATAFSKLDRRFKSHDGFKITHRIILDRMLDGNGYFNYYRDQESALLDVERTFLILDEKRVPDSYAGIVGQLRNKPHGRCAGMVESEYFRLRYYENGNCHVWMKRKDLVKKVNRLLADWYGETIADGMTAEADPLKNPKLTPAKRYGFFPTPDGAADALFGHGVPLLRGMDKPALRVLEPSAGTGNLARRCVMRPLRAGRLAHEWERERSAKHNAEHRFDNQVDCVEVQPELADALRKEAIYRKVWCQDFLGMKPDPAHLYDVVVMNPPFDLERDVDHVSHALDFLAPDGFLTAIMSAGTEWRETPKSNAFRKLIAKMGGDFRELPAGSFASAGTNVNTTVLRVWKNGRPGRW